MSTRPRKVGVFPGQFDPITNGHLDVIRRGAGLFDELVVAVSNNPDKREFFTMDERVEMVRELVADMDHVRVEQNPGLTFKFAQSVKGTALLRGIRDASDLRGEFQTALANRSLSGIETVFIMTGDQYALTSSSLIRQVVGLGGDVRSLSGLLPAVVIQRLRQKQRHGDFPLAAGGSDVPVG
jgi:pantetheine-phosphate adenylyltransferase